MSTNQPAFDVIMVDNFDSFTFNLVDAFEQRGARVQVYRHTVSAETLLNRALQAAGSSLIVLSPGPGLPLDAGSCLELVKLAKGRVPVLGICLGHQILLQEAGVGVERAPEIVHGKSCDLQHDQHGCFAGMGNPLTVGRYHSLAVESAPDRFHVHARLGSMVMAISDAQARQVGLQFHPESILTPEGHQLLGSILDWFFPVTGTRKGAVQ